jgi:hypothetical protein
VSHYIARRPSNQTGVVYLHKATRSGYAKKAVHTIKGNEQRVKAELTKMGLEIVGRWIDTVGLDGAECQTVDVFTK